MRELTVAAILIATCGAACAETIVLPDEPTPVEASAADELSDAIGRMTGRTPKRLAEREAAAEKGAFFVGATREAASVTNALGKAAWRHDEVLVRSVPRGVVLAGHPRRGVFYAVDEYLERFCGVRWWTSSESTYPARAALPTEGLDYAHVSPFVYRETYYLDSFHARFKVRTKGNFSSLTRYMLDPMEFVPPELGGDHRFHCFARRQSAYHSFFEILPPDRHFKDHSDWYSERDGKRVAYQLCLCNEEMTEAFIAETRRVLQSDPSADFISISQNDCTRTDPALPCTCAACRKVYAEEGAHAGGLLRFVNRVAAALEPEFPHVRFDTFAYTWSRVAPKKTRPRPNVTVRYCDIECPFSFPLDTKGNPKSEKFMANLRAWSEIAAGNLYIWDYVVGFRNYMLPHPNLHALARNVRIFAEAGAVGVFEQGDALCPAGEFAALKYWLVSHLLWDPQADDKALLDDFLSGYYGKAAAPKVRDYLALVNDEAFEKRIPVGCYHYNVTNFMNEAKVFAAERTMADAVRLAVGEGEAFARRVRREKLSIDQALLLNWKEYRAWAQANGAQWPLDHDYGRAVEAWIAAAEGFGVKAVHETRTRGGFDVFCQKLREGRPDR